MSNEAERTLEIHEVNWEALSVHAKQGRVVFIAPESTLEVSDVAAVLLEDRAAELKAWLSQGEVVQPDDAFIQSWDGKRWSVFSFAIVQPFVVAKLLREVLDGSAQDPH